MCSCLSLKCLSLRKRVFDGSTPSMKAELMHEIEFSFGKFSIQGFEV